MPQNAAATVMTGCQWRTRSSVSEADPGDERRQQHDPGDVVRRRAGDGGLVVVVDAVDLRQHDPAAERHEREHVVVSWSTWNPSASWRNAAAMTSDERSAITSARLSVWPRRARERSCASGASYRVDAVPGLRRDVLELGVEPVQWLVEVDRASTAPSSSRTPAATGGRATRGTRRGRRGARTEERDGRAPGRRSWRACRWRAAFVRESPLPLLSLSPPGVFLGHGQKGDVNPQSKRDVARMSSRSVQIVTGATCLTPAPVCRTLRSRGDCVLQPQQRRPGRIGRGREMRNRWIKAPCSGLVRRA